MTRISSQAGVLFDSKSALEIAEVVRWWRRNHRTTDIVPPTSVIAPGYAADPGRSPMYGIVGRANANILPEAFGTLNLLEGSFDALTEISPVETRANVINLTGRTIWGPDVGLGALCTCQWMTGRNSGGGWGIISSDSAYWLNARVTTAGVLTGLDSVEDWGGHFPSDTVTANNRHGWAGADIVFGSRVTMIWDQEAETWQAIQMDCPP